MPEEVKTCTLGPVAPAGRAVDCQVVPFEVRMLPEVLGATRLPLSAEVPLPRMTLLEVIEDAPVPPSATAISVPFQTPVAIVPTEVNEEPVTPEPSVVADRTDVPLIS